MTFFQGLCFPGALPHGIVCSAGPGRAETRYLGDGPANKDNCIAAKGYCITDMNLNYSFRGLNPGIITENIFNAKWNETQYAAASRLYNEPQPVTEIQFTPGVPFNIKGAIALKF